MKLPAVPNREATFEQPSSKTLNVGAPTFWASDDGVGSEFVNPKPSDFTLNVGAPTFSHSNSGRGGLRPPSSPFASFVLADLQLGASTDCRPAPLAGLKTGHYPNQISPAVSR
jgi:hypothetical protein